MGGYTPRQVLDIGDRVAGYLVEDFVAHGGMAQVYRARDLSLDRPVALKVIAPEIAAVDNFRKRFVQESNLAASLENPNVIPIYSAGEDDGLLYLAMRYVPDDLGRVIRARGPLAPPDVLPLVMQIAGALDAAHRIGLVHRDVKPGNILLTGIADDAGRRHAYLTDFGLTKRLASKSGHTDAGDFIGTLNYVSPEQLANRPADQRSDLYSFACVVYECFAGRTPFVREDMAALVYAHVEEVPPLLSALRPDLPDALDAVLLRAMAKSPADRYESCPAFASALEAIFRLPGRRDEANPLEVPSEESGEPRAGRLRRSKPTSAIVLILSLLLIAALGTWFAVRRGQWLTYTGTEYSEGAVVVSHPPSWKPFPHPGQFVVLAPVDLSPVFTPLGDWDAARGAAGTEGRMLVGVYVNSTQEINPGSFTSVPDQIENQFKSIANLNATAADPPPNSAVRVKLFGTMKPLTGKPEPQLYYELVLLPNGAGRPGYVEVMVFCRSQDRAANEELFQRVIGSLRPV